VTATGGPRSGTTGGGASGSLTLIHTSKVPNPHGCSLSGPLDPSAVSVGGACRGPGFRPVYSALDPVTGARVLLPIGEYFDKAGQLRGRDAKSTP
jgi:hypothetical protein